ncbi:MAG: hypothetical protein K2F99_07400 [Muribaculaceae bacterium]|nr:hypothetical protein [Muribaculaceae bacterium]
MSKFDPKSLGWHTGATPSNKICEHMASIINDGSIHENIRSTFIHMAGSTKGSTLGLNLFDGAWEFRYPVVISVIGVATSGKNTFTDFVRQYCCKIPGLYRVEDISIMDPIFEVSKQLADMLHDKARMVYPLSQQEFVNNAYPDAKETMYSKSDAWRQFVHDLKSVWMQYNEGPMVNTVLQIVKTCKLSLSDYLAHGNDLAYTTSIIFIQNRDLDSVQRLAEICSALGLIHLTLKIENDNVRADEWMNDCDSNVDEIPFDVLVHNSDSTLELSRRANTFARLFAIANFIYGVKNPEFKVGAATDEVYVRWDENFGL